MEWWYKLEKDSVSSENTNSLKGLLHNELLKTDSLGIANLYDDEEFFYIKTSNNIVLYTFLVIHGFEEIYNEDELDEDELNLLYGRMV